MLSPILVTLFFAVSASTEKYQSYEKISNVHKFLSLVSRLDKLIYELQNERGTSTGLSSTSGVDYFRGKIKHKRYRTNKALEEYRQQLAHIDLSSFSQNILERLARLNRQLEKLDIYRNEIDTGVYQQTIRNYSKLTNSSINFILTLQELTIDEKLSRRVDAYTNLLWLRERAGQERSMLLWILASGQINTSHFSKAISLSESQNTILKNYYLKTEPEYRNSLREKLLDSVDIKVSEYRKDIINQFVRIELLNKLLTFINSDKLAHNSIELDSSSAQSSYENIMESREKVQAILERFKHITPLANQDIYYFKIIENMVNTHLKRLDDDIALSQYDAILYPANNIVDDGHQESLKAIAHFTSGHIDKDPLNWWHSATHRINLIQAVSQDVKQDLFQRTAFQMQKEQSDLRGYLVLTIGVFMISFLLGTLLVRRLATELKDIADDMKKMSVEAGSGQLLNVSGQDELGLMATSFNTLIKERQKSIETLQLAAEVFANISDAIIIANSNKIITMVNPACTRLTGYDEREILGNDFLYLNTYALGKVDEQSIWNSVMHGAHWHGEVWFERPDGKKYLAWINISTVLDQQGEVVHYIGAFRDITDRKEHEEMIWRQANFDSLTDLPNRKMCLELLAKDLQAAAHKPIQLAILFIDLDGFKLINDTLGHDAGDHLLKIISKRLKHCLRESDIVSRLGGDEFIIRLKHFNTVEDVILVSKKILHILSEPLFLVEKHKVSISGSIGISMFPTDGTEIETLIKHADIAMYHSKNLGRNKFFFYSDADNQPSATLIESQS